MGTIKITLRSDRPLKKTNVKGQCKYPLRLQYSISGSRAYYETGEKLFLANWDADQQRAIFIKKGLLFETEIKKINDRLNELAATVRRIERRFEDSKIAYTPAMVMDELSATLNPEGPKKSTQQDVFDFIDMYIAEHRPTRAEGSLKGYTSLRNHLVNFGERLKFERIDYGFFSRFQEFLLNAEIRDEERKVIKGPINNHTTAKYLSRLKTILNYAAIKGIIVSDKYKTFKLKRENAEVIALTSEEFETLFYLNLTEKKSLEQVRDIFCFACATGLRYSDLRQLRREQIKDNEIRLTVKKTKERLTIPLNPYSRAILAKYSRLPEIKKMVNPLPVISNQKLNEYLKELCELAEINEPVEKVRYRGQKRIVRVCPKYELITCHTARKTFCTVSLEKGMSAEQVMSISGHRDYRSFRRYVAVTDKHKEMAMAQAWGKDVILQAV